jgi:asparaginyl-tRNA synthetase
MERTKVSELIKHPEKIGYGNVVCVKGWVRTKRGNNAVSFIALNDGSIVHSIQVVADMAKFDAELMKLITTGSCLKVEGILVQSEGKVRLSKFRHKILKYTELQTPESYPLQKKGHSMEFLREIAHLRPRTNYFGCVLRLRMQCLLLFINILMTRLFLLHTPLITGSDAEGAGAMFNVTTLDLNNIPKLLKEKLITQRTFLESQPV